MKNEALDRRGLLRALGAFPVLAAGAAVLPVAGCRTREPQQNAQQAHPVHPLDHPPVTAIKNQPSNFDQPAEALLEEIRERAAHYFLDRADPATGIVYDRAPADGKLRGGEERTGSIAATGFGLSALCVAARHGYLPQSQCEQRILGTLRFLAERAPQQHGFFPHYLHARTGAPASGSEYSSIDTALLLAGALHARRSLNSAAAERLASLIYERVEWPWMLGDRGEATLSMGWMPDSGFLPARWDTYSECLLMYLLAIGSPTHPLQQRSWNAIVRNTFDYGGIRFISSFGALFIHQYLHIWADVRGLRDGYANYFENSVSAVRAHKTWCMLQHGRYPWVDERVWGFSASDSDLGSYMAWAAPPIVGSWDGTLAPHAAGGSLPLMPEECIVVLKAMREHHPRCFRRYGYVNAFNPGADGGKGWFDTDVIASDLGLTMLMAENHSTGSVRAEFMRNAEMRHALAATGFRSA